MASDYIYIFCIPGSSPARREREISNSRVSELAPADVHSASHRRTTGPGRLATTVVDVHCAQTAARCRTADHDVHFSSTLPHCSRVTGRPIRIDRPLSSVMDVPDDWAPLPARRSDTNVVASSHIAADSHISREHIEQVIHTGHLNAGVSVACSPLVTLNAPDGDQPCVLPSYSSPAATRHWQPRAHCDDITIGSSPFIALHWSPRALSTPTRVPCQRLCTGGVTGAKNCWQRICSRACCLRCLFTVTTFRWLLLFFASLGAGCIVSGIVLGVLHLSLGASFLALSVMFLGLGVVLIVVISIGWRCTPSGHEPCHLLFNLDHWLDLVTSRGGCQNERQRDRIVDRNQWFGGVIYPEFRSRTPPPSYSASVLDYQDRHPVARRLSLDGLDIVPSTPPPAYRTLASNNPRSGADPDAITVVPPSYHPRVLRSRHYDFTPADIMNEHLAITSASTIPRPVVAADSRTRTMPAASSISHGKLTSDHCSRTLCSRGAIPKSFDDVDSMSPNDQSITPGCSFDSGV